MVSACCGSHRKRPPSSLVRAASSTALPSSCLSLASVSPCSPCHNYKTTTKSSKVGGSSMAYTAVSVIAEASHDESSNGTNHWARSVISPSTSHRHCYSIKVCHLTLGGKNLPS